MMWAPLGKSTTSSATTLTGEHPPLTLLGAQKRSCAPVARELGWESELMGTAAGLALVVTQCCSHPQNSLGHGFTDPQK